MKSFSKILALGAVLAASSSLAFADPITGTLTIGAVNAGTTSAGTDMFNTTGVYFTPNAGTVSSASGTLGSYNGTTVQLNNLIFASAANSVLFSEGSALSFTISSIAAPVFVDDAFVDVEGDGTFTEAGYANTTGSFTLSSSDTAGTFNFEITGAAAAVTPEPNSLVLMGTGLLAAAGMLFSRRRNAANLL